MVVIECASSLKRAALAESLESFVVLQSMREVAGSKILTEPLHIGVALSIRRLQLLINGAAGTRDLKRTVPLPMPRLALAQEASGSAAVDGRCSVAARRACCAPARSPDLSA